MISLKALVDREKKRVIFAESDEDFVDVLFSFLTLPMGTIIRRVSDQPPAEGLGCMINLYESIKNLGMQYFRTEAYKTMLLYPRNSAAAHCNGLKLQIDDNEHRGCLFNTERNNFKYKPPSLSRNTLCDFGGFKIYDKMELSSSDESMVISESQYRAVFVNGLARFIISDELEVKPSSTEASFTILSKAAFSDGSTLEECNINMRVDEVLTLLKCSLVSRTPFTDTLLKHNLVTDFGKDVKVYPSFVRNQETKTLTERSRASLRRKAILRMTARQEMGRVEQGSYIKYNMEAPASNVNLKINVKLIISKSDNIVCYAEASEDFVDLLSRFLTVPLGYMLKEIDSSISKGSIYQLYNSVQELDAGKYLKSDKHKTMLVNPKLAPDFSSKNNRVSSEEDLNASYNYFYELFSNSNVPSASNVRSSTLTIKDPNAQSKETGRGEGIVRGPAMFTVTDNLIIKPTSQISNLSFLTKLNVRDIEERVVQVGSQEALRLLVASFVSESALTNALLRETNPELTEELPPL